MNRVTNEEASELADATRAACRRYSPEARVREIAYEQTDPQRRGFDELLWQVLCQQLGVGSLAVPEHLGGAGAGSGALGVVARVLGGNLAPAPLLASAVLSTGLLVDCADRNEASVPSSWFEELMSGTRTAAAVLTTDGGPWSPESTLVTASRLAGDAAALTGTARHVLHGPGADDLVVVARVDERIGIFWLAADGAGVTRTAESVLDPTRPMAVVRLENAPALRISGTHCAGDLVQRRVAQALAVLSAEQVGANERLLDLATGYAISREQFGRPIGSFQAVKHRCADMLVDLEWSRSASEAALQAADDDPAGTASEANWRSAMAKAVCSESLRAAAHSNVQIHGGIGFTWESEAHLYLRRARTDEVLFGAPAFHWDVVTCSPALGHNTAQISGA